jgi:chlorite dismutase
MISLHTPKIDSVHEGSVGVGDQEFIATILFQKGQNCVTE